MYRLVKVRVGYQRYRYQKRLFCDQCGKEVHWVVPQKDITSTLHICDVCDRKNKSIAMSAKGVQNKLPSATESWDKGATL